MTELKVPSFEQHLHIFWHWYIQLFVITYVKSLILFVTVKSFSTYFRKQISFFSIFGIKVVSMIKSHRNTNDISWYCNVGNVTITTFKDTLAWFRPQNMYTSECVKLKVIEKVIIQLYVNEWLTLWNWLEIHKNQRIPEHPKFKDNFQ